MSASKVSRRWGVLLQLLAAVAVTAALLVTAELVAGRLLPRPDAVAAADPLRLAKGNDAVSKTLEFLDINLVPLDKDVDLLWRNRSSVRKRQPVNPRPFGREDEWSIVTNARGFRGAELPPGERDAGVYRVLCIGDSVTFGFNADQDDTFPRQLERALQERFPGRRIEVVNAGVPGWSWVQGVTFLRLEGLALRPDLVVISHGANDRYFSATITDAERLAPLQKPEVRWVESLRLLLEQTNSYRAVSYWFAPKRSADDVSPGCQQQIEQAGSCRRVALGEIEQAVHEARRLTEAAGVDVLVLNVDFEVTDAVQAMRRGVEAEHVPFIDFVSRFAELRRAVEAERAQRLGLAPALMDPDAWRRKIQPPSRVLFRVQVAHHPTEVRVKGSSIMQNGLEFQLALRDDGSDGDERAADGVWSGRLVARPNTGELLYRFFSDGAPEFEALPPLPSQQADRHVVAVGNVIAPVERFGEVYLMTERMHPNAAGHEVIAAGVADAVAGMPSFTRAAVADHH